jgi:D-alanyl-lipoteichoic acid acyltransferase DltB (MBOAT superfamily)
MRPQLLDRHAVVQAYMRLFVGVLKVAGLAVLCLRFHQRFADWFDGVEAGQIPFTIRGAAFRGVATFYLFPAYIYLNFSGSCDIVIAGALLCGMRLPENFDQPYLARNMIDFWNRWHRTLSFWIRDYLFTPMYKALAERWPRQAGTISFLAYFVALFLAGVWHGSTWNFVVFGVLQGLGVSAAKVWENRIIRARGRSGLRRYLGSRPIRALAVGTTFHFACFTFLFFSEGMYARLLRVVAKRI